MKENNPLRVSIGKIRLSSPLVLCSGILGLSASSLKRVADEGAGAVTTKSCGLKERPGHPCPAIIPFEHGLLNAVGLSNPGVAEMVREVGDFRSRTSTPVIASVFGANIEEFGIVTEKIAEAKPDMIEVNISCPNVASEFGLPFGSDPNACAQITKLVRKKAGKIPVSMKLTANCPSIAQIAKICQDNGADAITAINSIGPGMLVDVNVRKPVLANRTGGVSGPCILPIAVRCVWDIFRAVKIPIIGGGGVSTPEGALQMILAGATAIGIGTGVFPKGLSVFNEINDGIRAFMREKKITKLSSLIGGAHG